jgi:CBS domain-containing protein
LKRCALIGNVYPGMLLRPQVRELVHEELVYCSGDSTVGEAVGVLLDHRARGLVVTNRNGMPIGSLGEADILAAEWPSSGALGLDYVRRLEIEKLMARKLPTIDVSAPLWIAAERMREENSMRLIVVERGKPVAMLTIADLLAYLGRNDDGIAARVVGDAMSRAVPIVRARETIGAAARALARGLFPLVVLDEQDRPVGVVTSFDVIRTYSFNVAAAVVADVMRPFRPVRPGTPLRHAAEVLLREGVDGLPVAASNRGRGLPVGVVTSSDIVAALLRRGPEHEFVL